MNFDTQYIIICIITYDMNSQTVLVLVFIHLCLKALEMYISYTNWKEKETIV